MKELGKLMMWGGGLLLLMGVLVYLFASFGDKLPHWLGRLPGDIRIRRPNFVFYAPITTMLLLSLLLSGLMWIIQRFFK